MKKMLKYLFFGIVGLVVLMAFLFFVRQGMARAQIEGEWQAVPAFAPPLETTRRLEVIPFYENDRLDDSLDSGHGVSYLIRTDSTTVLMDLGHNPSKSPQLPSLQNMQALGIGWEEIDAIVISHPHPDHVGGVEAWRNQTVSFGDISEELDQLPLYAPIPMIHPDVTIVHSERPTQIGSDIATTGVIAFPEVFPISLFGPKGHEQGLVIHVAGQGLVVITGCGHPTLEKLVSRAETLYSEQVVGVLGGLHYGEAGREDLQPQIDFLELRQPKLIALSPHDSSPAVLEIFQSTFSGAYQSIQVGKTIQFP